MDNCDWNWFNKIVDSLKRRRGNMTYRQFSEKYILLERRFNSFRKDNIMLVTTINKDRGELI